MAGAIKRKAVTGGARHELDKFYTLPAVADSCVSKVRRLFSEADLIVEPSAGDGAFLGALEFLGDRVKAFDLVPEDVRVVRQDWFDVTREMLGDPSKLAVVGNPPFGVRSDLAKRFIKHSVDLGAETIAFLLPRTFSKISNQSVRLFPSEYRLVVEDDVRDNAFMLEGSGFHIPVRWFVWTKNEGFMTGVDLRKVKALVSDDFVFRPRGAADADFVVNGNSGKVKLVSEVTNPKAEHYIRVVDRTQVDVVKERFTKLVFDFNSSVNGGVAWVGKQEILAAYNEVC